jgi:hypothetical protein
LISQVSARACRDRSNRERKSAEVGRQADLQRVLLMVTRRAQAGKAFSVPRGFGLELRTQLSASSRRFQGSTLDSGAGLGARQSAFRATLIFQSSSWDARCRAATAPPRAHEFSAKVPPRRVLIVSSATKPQILERRLTPDRPRANVIELQEPPRATLPPVLGAKRAPSAIAQIG